MATVGVDLGGTKIQAIRVESRPDAPAAPPAGFAALAEGGDYTGPVGGGYLVVGSGRVPTPTSGGAELVAEAVVAAIREAGADGSEPIGVAFAGPVDSSRGVVVRAPNVTGFGESVPFASLVAGQLGDADVVLENDVNAGTYGEWRLGAGQGSTDLLGIFVGTGVGGGLVLDGHLRRGPHGFAGEVGHIIVKQGGRKPPAGFEGSLEAYAGRASMEAEARRRVARGSHTHLFDIARKKGRDRLTSGIFRRAVKEGDKMAEELLRRAESALGVGIASLVNALDLELVVVGGGVADAFGDDFVERVAAEMRPFLIAPEAAPAVRPAALGDLAGGLGAALLAEHREDRAAPPAPTAP